MAKILLWPVNKKFEDTQRCKTCTDSLYFVERNCDDPQWYCSSLYIVSVVSGKYISMIDFLRHVCCETDYFFTEQPAYGAQRLLALQCIYRLFFL